MSAPQRSFNQLIILAGLALLFTACSSGLHMLDYWTSEDFREPRARKFLIVCRTDSLEIRKEFEYAIVRKLRKQGINAGESYILLPSLEPNSAMDEDSEYKEFFLEAGYDGVVLAGVKNVIESIKSGSSTAASRGPYALSTTYVVEASVYDLKMPEGKELVGINLVGITDPESPAELTRAYSRIIGRHFKKQ